MRRRVIAAGVLVLAMQHGALACSCRLPSADALLSSPVIFSGRALGNRLTGPGEAVTTFRVTAAYKGTKRGQLIRIHHRNGPSASCGVRFTAGGRHTLAAEDRDGKLSISACTAAAMRSEAGDELVHRFKRR